MVWVPHYAGRVLQPRSRARPSPRWLLRGLSFLWTPATPHFEHVKGRQASVGNNALFSANGRFKTYSADNATVTSGIDFGVYQPLTSNTAWTIGALCAPDTSGGSNGKIAFSQRVGTGAAEQTNLVFGRAGLFLGYASGWEVYHRSSAASSGVNYADNNNPSTGFQSVPDGQLRLYGASRTASSLDIWRDGANVTQRRSIAAINSGNFFPATQQTSIGRLAAFSTNAGYSGSVPTALVFAFDGYTLDEDEWAEIAANPLTLFDDEPTTSFFLASGGGPSTVEGTLAATEAPDTLASAGAVPLSGTLAATEAADTLAATGLARKEVAGTLAATEAADAASASGSAETPAPEPSSITGTLAATEARDTFAATGLARKSIAGTLAAAESRDTAQAIGTAYKAVTGAFEATEAPDTLLAVGVASTLISGVVEAAEAADSMSAGGYAGFAHMGLMDATAVPEAQQLRASPGSWSLSVDADAADARADVEPQQPAVALETAEPVANVAMFDATFNAVHVKTLPLDRMYREVAIPEDALRFALALRFDEYLLANDAIHVVRGRAPQDTILLADNLSITATWHRDFADSVTTHDEVRVNSVFQLAFTTDFVSPTDDVSRIVGVVKADPVSLLDAASVMPRPAATDSAGTADEMSWVVSWRRDFEEEAAATDAAAHAFVKSLSDLAPAADSVGLNPQKALSDAAGTADTQRLRIMPRPADSATPLDALAISMRFMRRITDSVTAEDSADVRFPGRLDKLDVLRPTDAIGKALNRLRTDTFAATDAQSIRPWKQLSEVAAVSDSGTITFDGGYADDYFASDYTEATTITF